MNHRIKFAVCSAEEPEQGSWFQVTPPYGEYDATGTIDGFKDDAVLVFDEETTTRIMAAFQAFMAEGKWPGVLVDREHFSLDYDKPSDAMAWAVDIRREADGSLWTKWEFTPEGLAVWQTKTLVSRSPVLELEEREPGRFYPVSLQSVGMTNTPHFKELSTVAAAKAVNTEKEKPNMEKIIESLGLPAEATEEQILEAIKGLKDGAAAAEAKATDAEKQLTDAEKAKEECEAECRGLKADAFISEHRDQIEDVAAFKESYLKDPEGAAKVLATCKKVATPVQTVLKSAKTPGTADVVAQLAACKSSKERLAFVNAHAQELLDAAK